MSLNASPRRGLAAGVALVLLGGFATACSRSAVSRSPGAPVVVVTIDTLRADRLPAWGYRAGATPALDRLAADGIRFENAWAAVPLTLPSHATLWTGVPPNEHGVRSNIGYRLDGARHPTLASRLRAAGYATGGAVSSYVLRAETGIAEGFDRFDDSLEVYESATLGELQRAGGATLDVALDWLDGAGSGPFFLWVHLFEPHTPYTPPEPFRSKFKDPYDGEIAAADALVGRLIGELERRGLYESALIVVASDHGEGLGDHGEAEHGILLYRESLHVPLLVKLPRGARAGETVTAPVGLVDVAPTVLAQLGLPPLPGQAGRSLLEPAAPDRQIYAETFYPRIHLGWSELRSLIDSTYQYIEGPDPELYDLERDPGERTNLRDREQRAFRSRRQQLAAVPANLAAASPASAEELAKLAALGYLSATADDADSGASRPDPKAHIASLVDIQRAHELTLRGELVAAEALARRVVEANPAMVDARVQLAATLRHLGRATEAREQYREVARRSPAHLELIAIEIAKIELELGDLAATEQNARLALASAPDEAHFLLASLAIRRADWTAAEREARAALGDAQRPRLPALILLAQALTQQGRAAEAEQLLAGAEARVGRREAAAVATLDSTLGDVLARLGRTAEAEAAFRREIARFPRTEEAYVRLAILLAAGHRFDEIEPTLDAMAAALPGPHALGLAADTLEQLGNTEGAAAYRRRARAAAASAAAARPAAGAGR